MAEYIKREELIKFPIRRNHYDKKHGDEHFINGVETVLEYAENLPAADVAPVRHGRWIDHKAGEQNRVNVCIECSECNTWFGHDCYAKPNYCPNCGAQMEGGAENEEN